MTAESRPGTPIGMSSIAIWRLPGCIRRFGVIPFRKAKTKIQGDAIELAGANARARQYE